jgi:exosome complex component RRP46
MIAVVPALLQASMLALLSSSIPLTIVLTSMSIAVDRRGNLTHNPPLGATESAASFHVLAFSSSGDLILAESEGKFSVDTWENAIEMARSRCRFECMDPGAADDDVNMDSRLTLDLEGSLRVAVQNEVLKRQRWKKSLG